MHLVHTHYTTHSGATEMRHTHRWGKHASRMKIQIRQSPHKFPTKPRDPARAEGGRKEKKELPQTGSNGLLLARAEQSSRNQVPGRRRRGRVKVRSQGQVSESLDYTRDRKRAIGGRKPPRIPGGMDPPGGGEGRGGREARGSSRSSVNSERRYLGVPVSRAASPPLMCVPREGRGEGGREGGREKREAKDRRRGRSGGQGGRSSVAGS
jgi:hypothetical protein